VTKSAPVVIVTGASSGIGLAAARALAQKGCRVYDLSRSGSDTDLIKHITADVTDEASVIGAVDAVVKEEGRVDILITSAGFGISGAAEFTPDGAMILQLDVNYFGTVHACRAVLPHMRRAGAGRILCVSSVAGFVGLPFQAHYSASKAAVYAFVMALHNEVRKFGINVCAVMPGDTKTGFTDAREKITEGDDVYSGRIERSVSKSSKDEQTGTDANFVGRFIARAALKKRVRPVLVPGFTTKIIIILSRLVPVPLAWRIVEKLYAS